MSIQTTHDEASARIHAFASEGRLVQGEWHKMNGVKKACLLGAIHSGINSEHDCPASLMPQWMARLTVRLFDGIRTERTQEYGLRYAAAMKSWATFTPEQWSAALTNILIYCVDSAVESARPVCEGKSYWPKVAEACATVTRLMKKGAFKKELKYAAYAANAYAANAANAYADAYAAADVVANARKITTERIFDFVISQFPEVA